MERFIIHYAQSALPGTDSSVCKTATYTAPTMGRAIEQIEQDMPGIRVFKATAVTLDAEPSPDATPTPGPGEFTSEQIGIIAARALRNPASISEAEIQALAGSCLTQRPNQ